MTIADFILARIAEDEAEVGVLAPGLRDESAGPNGVGWAEVGAISEVLMTSVARVRRECEAFRRIVETAQTIDMIESEWGQSILHDLAAIWVDHADFEQGWAQ